MQSTLRAAAPDCSKHLKGRDRATVSWCKFCLFCAQMAGVIDARCFHGILLGPTRPDRTPQAHPAVQYSDILVLADCSTFDACDAIDSTLLPDGET